MLNYLKKIFASPSLKGISLKSSSVDLSLNCLRTGVDNIRYDVFLSDVFCKSVQNIIFSLIAKHTGTEDILFSDKKIDIAGDKEQFTGFCRDILLCGFNQAKLEKEIQIDILVQVAIIKLLMLEINRFYESVSDRFKIALQRYEVTDKRSEAVELKTKIAETMKDRSGILKKVGTEIFQYFLEVQKKYLNDSRIFNFGEQAVIPDSFFLNPTLFCENPSDDNFMVNEYQILLGHRIEDPDKQDMLFPYLKNLLLEIHMKDEGIKYNPSDSQISKTVEAWLRNVENVDTLFNCFESKYQLNMLKKTNGDKDAVKQLKIKEWEQRKRLHFFYRNFKKQGLIKKIVAAYEIQPILHIYCPPLVPQLIVQFLISRRGGKNVKDRLQKLKKFYGKSFDLAPLKKKRMKILMLMWSNRKGYLIRFLKDVVKYNRDLQRYNKLKEAMDAVNLITEDKLINLSRANNTLYQFLLPHEHVSKERPIINHVIIKADVRGSTDITHQMLQQGLNPASYFSLNFFDPITQVLSEYGASKVFVEGDAIILSIFEHQETPEGWYGVARACGLASEILGIVKQCNIRNIKHNLPIIELGLGISYYDNVPAFLFDGNNKIMISSAINKADRLSGCSKVVRKKMMNKRKPFKLYVFQSVSDKELSDTKDDIFLRYNVNGIELNSEGFHKLEKEIDLKPVNITIGDSKNKVMFYTGKFPNISGEYKRLLIRESLIPQVDQETFKIISFTAKKYYEVCCTSSKLYNYVKKHINAHDQTDYPKL